MSRVCIPTLYVTLPLYNAGVTPIDTFDFAGFTETLRKEPREAVAEIVAKELERVRPQMVRDAGKRFSQQTYLKNLERLGRAMAGEDATKELTPAERQSHRRL